MMLQARQPETRRGFTMLELLVVIGIIALLATLSVTVMYGLLDQAEEEATSATIRKVAALLEQRSEAFDRAFRGTRRDNYIRATQGLLRGKDIYGAREEVVEILAKKAAFRYEFAQRVEERTESGDAATIVNSAGVPLPDPVANAILIPVATTELVEEGVIADRSNLSAADITAIQNRVAEKWELHDRNTESSELLYFALIASGSFGATSVDADRFTGEELTDTDGDGLPEFVDAWGQPLRFYRWPTRLMDTNPPFPFEPVLDDPNDGTDVVVTVDTSGDGNPDTTVGVREVDEDERAVANILLRGLPPSPALLPNGAFPRDMMLTDPDDPVGRLYSELERLDGNNGRPNFGLEFNEAAYHTPDTYHVPLIISGGPDEDLGLYEPWQYTFSDDNDNSNDIFGNLAQYDLSGGFADMIDRISDNLSNRNKRAGGR